MKKKSRLYYRNKADRLWSEIIMSKGACEVCGKKTGLNPHHIISKKNLTLRHDLRNGCCLCYQHHVGGRQSAHGDFLWFEHWLIQNRDEDLVYLDIKRVELATKIDYEEVIEKLRKEVK